MTDRRNVKFEIVEHRGVPQKIPHYYDLVKAKRWRLGALVSTMALVVILGFVFSSDNDTHRPTQITAFDSYTNGTNPVISPEVTALKGQFVGLISGSIESKLRTLEDNIRTGAISNSLGTIQDLKNDVKVLRAYSSPNTAEPSTVSNAQLIKEVSHLRNLIYLTLTSCGLMIAAVASIWIKNRKKLIQKNKADVTHYLGKN
jgi:hypothetical protein